MHSNTAPLPEPAYEERRSYQRVDVDLLGRFMLENMREYPCRVETMSPGDASVISPVVASENERVILYVDHIGRLEGSVARVFAGGFAIALRASERKREKLAAQLTWLANRHELGLPEDRRHERVATRSGFVEISTADGRNYKARLLDLSLSGAALESEIRPAIGTRVVIGTMAARVVRHLERGFAVEFAAIQDHDSLERAFG